MPYMRKKTFAGRTVEIREYYSRKYPPPGESRQKREKLTPEAQRIQNRMAAERRLRHLINENFGPGDWHLDLTYQKELRPTDKEELARDKQIFFRKLRKEYRAQGKELKYIYVAEVGSRGAMHHHIVMNAEVNPRVLAKVWTKGRVHIHPLDNTGQYRRLAAYLIKYSDQTLGTEDALQGQRYIPSRNLKKPREEVQVMRRNQFPKEPAVPKGHYLDKDSVREGVSDVTGYRYREYTVIRFDDGG